MNVFSKVLEQMHFTLFEVDENDSFHPLQDVPLWLLCLYDEKISQVGHIEKGLTGFRLCEAFAFVQYFLEEGRINFDSCKPNYVESGIWTEESMDGQVYQCCAFYFCEGKKEFVLLENRTPTFKHQHDILQKARNIALLNEHLLQRAQRKQRQLESEIEQQWQQSTKSAAELIENTSSAIMVCRNDGQVEILNQALMDIYRLDKTQGFEKVPLLEQWVSEAQSQYPEIQRVLRSGSHWEGEIETASVDGSKKWIRLSISAVSKNHNPMSHYLCIASDIDEFKTNNRLTEDEKQTDLITKLPNRSLFLATYQGILQYCKVNQERSALLFIDLDYFKRINTEFGYSTGDFLLKIVAARILSCVAESDFVAHMGGDEFAVVLRNAQSDSDLEKRIVKIADSIKKTITLGSQPIYITSSMGCAIYPDHGSCEKTMIKSADLAMYYAKEQGRNRHQRYDDKLQTVTFAIERDKELFEALEKEQFFLEYQPQICLSTPQQMRLETLIRWQHPKTGRTAPDQFIDSAERSGLIVPIGSWVMEQACIQAQKLLKQHIDVIIAINVSPKQLKHPDFCNSVTDMLAQYELPASCIEVEITETCMLEGIDQVIDALNAMRAAGVSISLDDFGSGFSSFNYLKQLPLDILKIDRTFITELETSNESRVIATMIINLAKALGLTVIAEGVETKEQLDFLIGENCDIVQGFYFYKPLPQAQLASLPEQLRRFGKMNKGS